MVERPVSDTKAFNPIWNVSMGLRDRDYMRKKPSDDDWDRYERESNDRETRLNYGDMESKRRSRLRWLVIGFVFLLLLILIVTLALSCS